MLLKLGDLITEDTERGSLISNSYGGLDRLRHGPMRRHSRRLPDLKLSRLPRWFLFLLAIGSLSLALVPMYGLSENNPSPTWQAVVAGAVGLVGYGFALSQWAVDVLTARLNRSSKRPEP